MELILLAAIAYAAARGIESMAANVHAGYHSEVAERTAKKVAKTTAKNAGGGVKGGVTGTVFDPAAAAPRSATAGTKTAAVIATVAANPATHWRSFIAGYKAAWPTAREEVRNGMTERAAQRAADRANAGREAVKGKATPPSGPKPASAPAAPAGPGLAKAPAASRPGPGAPPVAAKPPATGAGGRPALSIVQPEPTGESVSIPEVRTLDGLMNALAIVKGASLMRAEEAAAIAADDATMAARLDSIEAELAGLEVDPGTLAGLATLRDLISAQSAAAQEHGVAAQNAADLAAGAADAAQRSHGGINEAVRSAPIKTVAEAGYYNR